MLKLLCGLACTALAAAPATAGIITTTVQGTFSSGRISLEDNEQIFSLALPAPFTLTTVFDTRKGEITENDINTRLDSSPSSSPGTAQLLLLGRQFNFSGLRQSSYVVRKSNPFTQIISGGLKPNGAASAATGVDIRSIATVPFSIFAEHSGVLDRVFVSAVFCPECTINSPDLGIFENVRSVDAVYSIQVTDVPEPATWATMIAGFWLLGAALRGRRGTAIRYG